MTSSKRQFDDFNAFPGEVNKLTGYYEFPSILHIDSMKRERSWQLFIRLVKQNNPQSGIDWNLTLEAQLPIVDDYFVMGQPIPDGTSAQAWVETGITTGKITRNQPSYFSKSKNVGKSNERNAFQCALIYGRSLYLKKYQALKAKRTVKTSLGVNQMFFPMLARTFDKGFKFIKFPCKVQPKLDGVRCLTYLREYNGGWKSVICYTRTMKEFAGMDAYKKVLYPYLNDLFDNDQSIFLDGELYTHGKSLQDISGNTRRSAETTTEYHIYDCFYPKELDTDFIDRYEQLIELFKHLSHKRIKLVPVEDAKSLGEVKKIFKKYTKKKYEGIMMRNILGGYMANSKKTSSSMRSKNLVKMKQRFSDEFKVVGYTQGKRGKDVGAIIWVCETTGGNQFNVTPKSITYKERKKLFNDAEKNFTKKYLGRMITIEYEDLSNDGVPLRAKALTFRDYE